MADLLFTGLKAVFGAFRVYSEKLEEFAQLKDDAEELFDRIAMVEVSVLRLENSGKLSDDLALPLKFCTKSLENTKNYVMKVRNFCVKQQRLGNLKTVALAVANSSLEILPATFPEQLKPLAEVMLGELGGAPDKEFDKLAGKIEARVSALTCAVAVQLLDPSTKAEAKGGPVVPPPPKQETMEQPAAKIADPGDVTVEHLDGIEGSGTNLEAEQEVLAQKMGALLEEEVQEGGDDIQAFRIRSSFCQKLTTWGVVIGGKAYCLIVRCNYSTPTWNVAQVIWFLLPSIGEIYSPELQRIGSGWTLSFHQGIDRYLEAQKSINPQYYQEALSMLKLPIRYADVLGCCGICVEAEQPGQIWNQAAYRRQSCFPYYYLCCAPCIENEFVCKVKTQGGEFDLKARRNRNSIKINDMEFS